MKEMDWAMLAKKISKVHLDEKNDVEIQLAYNFSMPILPTIANLTIRYDALWAASKDDMNTGQFNSKPGEFDVQKLLSEIEDWSKNNVYYRLFIKFINLKKDYEFNYRPAVLLIDERKRLESELNDLT